MADVKAFFEKLPAKLGRHPEVAQAIRNVFRFEVVGAGTWTVDLREGSGQVLPGAVGDAGCVVSASKADLEALMADPSLAMGMFATGKLKVSNPLLALSLRKLF